MTNALVGRFDRLLGEGVEATVTAKHRRRLSKLGWRRVFEPSSPGVFATGDPPPREGCQLDVLIDGANALPEIAEAISRAKRFVHITGWHLEPAFELVRGRPNGAVGVLLAEMAEKVDVRVLVWSGAPVPLFHPSRGEVSETLDNLTRHTRIQAQGDPKEHPFHCHHEKTVIIDGEVAFVGGIDMTSSAGDRYDVQAHHARRSMGWHDVGTRLRGPAVADVNDHFRTRWLELTQEELPALPAPEPAGNSTVQVVRTVEEDMYDSLPRGDFSIFESYARVLRSARELIYLENQFLWSPELVSIIAEKLRHPPTPEFRVVVLLPAKANNGAEDTKGQVGRLIDADDDAGDQTKRFLAVTIRALSPTHDRADPVYVHAKVAAVDDRWLIVGSANLNAHSLFNDTEMCVATDDAALARDTRIRLWAEHLEMDEATVRDTPATVLVDDRWHPIADEQLERDRANLPATHRLLELPGASRRSARLLGPLNGLFTDG
ncbi:MAG TPA: phospholipase D-like domain-containing protein [Solirubrobacteraceae bacterium]|nr:phospholipase D-like domain-containing protein [Solirubrobacteraceae bacterium]